MLPNWYNEYKELIEKSINNYLVDYFNHEKNIGLNAIKEATLYSVKGGKRIRSILALEFYIIFSGNKFENIKEDDNIMKFCIAIELLHAYSLVHDDLPAMDNDVLRRGELTVWKKYGEANAILVGDLLNALSFEVLSHMGNNIYCFYLGQAVGLKGMLGGQVLDLYYEKNPDKLTLDNLIEIHNKKTGALIEASIMGGILCAEEEVSFVKDKNPYNQKIYLEFGKAIGLAFQVKDDLLDVEGSIEETGKSIGDGEKKGFIYFMGITKTKKYLNDLINDCSSQIDKLKSEKLDFLVQYIGNRNK